MKKYICDKCKEKIVHINDDGSFEVVWASRISEIKDIKKFLPFIKELGNKAKESVEDALLKHLIK